MEFVSEIERALGVTVRKTFMDMQKGDVPETWADCSLLQRLTGYRPETGVREGVTAFVAWYRDYYRA
jgi:UDP-glucuronate 4-epimerase